MRMRSGPRARAAALVLAVGATLAATPATVTAAPVSVAPASAPASAPDRPAVRAVRTLGKTVQGRPIVAWRLGQPPTRGVPTVVLISGMHGDEPASRHLLWALRDGPPILGVDLWVVPSYNPDGLAAGTRRNARGVDLNRNYPQDWADLDGETESGPRAASERETRAMMRFLSKVRPDWVLSFHQPLYGVDTDTKRPAFARRVARALGLPRKRFDCGGVCHGTMTRWFNAHHPGAALTVEYGASPSLRALRETAPGQVLGIFGAFRGDAAWEDGAAEDPVEAELQRPS